MKIQLGVREKIIGSHPFFALLMLEQIQQLSNLMEECTYKKGKVIVKEKDLINHIFFIVEGEAEVSKKIEKKSKTFILPITILSHAHSIGLSEEGFFSRDGRRTATVTALTDMTLLRIDTLTLSEFMQRTTHLYPGFANVNTQMLKIHFVKQLFNYFKSPDIENIDFILNNIQAIELAENEVIFEKGSPSNKCYFIVEGKIQVSSDQDLEKKILDTNLIFGEEAITSQLPRKFSTKTISKTKLLTINQAVFKNYQRRQDKKKSIKTLPSHYSPQKAENVKTEKMQQANGQELIILHNSKSHKTYYLNNKEWFIWQKIDGHKTILEISSLYMLEFEEPSDYIYEFLFNLSKEKFIIFPHKAKMQQTWFDKLKRRLFSSE